MGQILPYPLLRGQPLKPQSSSSGKLDCLAIHRVKLIKLYRVHCSLTCNKPVAMLFQRTTCQQVARFVRV